MMNRVFLIIALIATIGAHAQTAPKFDVYKPSANATKDIALAVALAAKQKKHVLIQAGGNWCSWCARFYKMANEDVQIDSLLKASFIVYHLNYSKENKNLPVFARYAYPQRFGFPVFIILDAKGKLLHTQNSAYLEEGKGYSKEKIMDFLTNWAPEALDPKKYKD